MENTASETVVMRCDVQIELTHTHTHSSDGDLRIYVYRVNIIYIVLNEKVRMSLCGGANTARSTIGKLDAHKNQP